MRGSRPGQAVGPGLDAHAPNVAHAYGCLLGGKNDFAADRQAASRLMEAAAGAAVAAQDSRAFLARAVRFLAEDVGICQFLDLGAGLPTAGSVHEIAQVVDPRAVRVVYADSDPAVVHHADTLLRGSLTTAVVRADLREPWNVFARPTVRTLINLAEPLAILLVAVLDSIEDHEDPWAIVNCYKDSMAPGSYLVISHITADPLSAGADRPAKVACASASAPCPARSREHVARFFGGLEMVSPGLVDVAGWRPDVMGVPLRPTVFYGGIGCKTRPGRPR
jgi:hypothetical protein